jgi:pantoate--beta-alanine ligase
VAIFGRKDAQQCLVIRQMVEDLRIPVALVDGPTVREADGLAMSSRNRYLNDEQRVQALCLSWALQSARAALVGGERRRENLLALLLDKLRAADKIEYAEIRQVPDLEETAVLSGTILLAVAARVGPARLIDNLVLELDEGDVRDGFLMGDPQQWSDR